LVSQDRHALTAARVSRGKFIGSIPSSGFLPLKYAGADGPYYGFLQIDMGADPGALPGAAIYVMQWVWDSSPNTTLTTFAVPEPTALGLLLVGLTPILRPRDRSRCRSGGDMV
jgi:hypothetical protein